MSVRPIFAILIAIAMVFAPFAMPASAMAMAPPDHQSQMMAEEHCGDQSPDGKDSEATGEPCCVATCTAMTLATATPVETQLFARVVGRQSLIQFTHGYLAELATPPPRRA